MANLGSFHPHKKRYRRSWAWLFWLLVLVGMVTGLNFRWGMIPPFGRLLSPFEGAWQVAQQEYHEPGVYSLKGRDGTIEIELDEDLIPHISAVSQRDLFYGQGFITAKHRLWQMDFQSRAAAGRLSEVIGPVTLEMDRFQRRFGIAEAARISGEMMMKDSLTQSVLLAYTEGINEAIEDWPRRQWPIEFKILDYEPEPWEPVNTGLLLKSMAYVLSGKSDDRAMSLILERYGKSVCDQLFPDNLVDEEPIIPKNTPWEFDPLPIPALPSSLGWTDTTDDRIPINDQSKLEDDNGIGSNNWAVDGTKTKSGYPILANDPHLSMKLPSTWYVAELKGPGFHAMGASLPGAPGIISGFNEQFSWGVTNGYPDVADWYKVIFKDNSRVQYWYNNQWKNVRKKVEILKIRGMESEMDTVYWTDLGPVVYKRGEKPKESFVPTGHALRWIAHDPSNELKAFLRLNTTNSVSMVGEALQTYSCPAQNFVVADRNGHIAMFAQQGKIPLRWKEQGKYLMLAGASDQHWQGYLPSEHLPRIMDPESGFVSSANQAPADTSYPYYLNWNYYNLERGRRINQLLSAPKRFNLADMRQVQNDTKNLWAERVLPEMLKVVRSVPDRQRWMTDALASWNYQNDPGEVGPTLFEAWFQNWMKLAWSDDFTNDMRWPDKHVTWQIFLEKDNSSWFDFRNTPSNETGSQLLIMALQNAADTLQKNLGSFRENRNAYLWGNYKATKIGHLGRMAGLGTEVLFTGGGKGIVNATSTIEGQSWKMLVQLGPKPEALAIYPGGQSGNPASSYYSNFTEAWRTGNYRKIRFRK